MTQNTADRLYLLLVDRLRVIGGTRHAAEDIAAEINALTAERDEAAKYRDQYVRECGELTAQLAEVERLRLKAHAWDTHRHAMFLIGEQDAALLKHEFECEDAVIASWEAEAKERGISPYEISGYTDMQMDQHQRMLEGYYTAMEAARVREARK